jgi:hypothetical protein
LLVLISSQYFVGLPLLVKSEAFKLFLLHTKLSRRFIHSKKKMPFEVCWLGGLVIALRQQTLKHISGGWSHYTDTSEPVDGNGAQNMVTVQVWFAYCFTLTDTKAY